MIFVLRLLLNARFGWFYFYDDDDIKWEWEEYIENLMYPINETRNMLSVKE